MFGYLRSLSFFAHCLLACLVIGPVLPLAASTEPNSEQSQSSPQSSVTPPTRVASKPQRLFAPHWTTQDGFQTTIYIRNVHIEQAVSATLSLVLDGRTITLPPTQIDPMQTISIDVTNALADSGEKLDQSGGATIDFEGESAGQLNAAAHVLDSAASLGFTFPFSPDGSTISGSLEGVAFYYGKNTDGFIALQNTTEKETAALPTIFVSGREISLGRKPLKPGEAATIKIPSLEDLSAASPPTAGPQGVGVRIEYEDNPGAVVAQGWTMDEAIGFSAAFSFHHKSSCDCNREVQHLYGAGIMIGSGGMGPGVIFSPYIATRNNSGEPTTVSPVFSFELDGKVRKVSLPGVALGPEEATVINLRKYQEAGGFPLSVQMGDIDVQYTGEAGAVVAELASVDQNGSFVSPAPLTCNGNPDQHMVFWRTDGDWHSSITVESITDKDSDLEITISYPGGIYVFEKTIATHESMMISINDLQQSQTPDSEGRRIPLDARMGGVNIWSEDANSGPVINAMLMNPVTRTCGSCGADGYVGSALPTEDYRCVNPGTAGGFEAHQVGDQFGLKIVLNWTSGRRDCVFPNYTTVTSYNPSVANMSGGNLVCYGPGNSYITAYTSGTWPTDSSCTSWHTILANALLSPVIQAKIKQGTTDITGTTRNVIVGQEISLTVEVLPAGTTTTNNQWSIPGMRIANYVVQYTDEFSNTSAMVIALTNPTGTAVDFYWVDGGDGRQVAFSFKVNGKSFTAAATFNVKRPTATFASTSVSNVTVDSGCGSDFRLHYGCPIPPGGSGPAGLTFAVTNLVIPSGFSGSTELVQIVDSTTRTQLKNTGTRITLSGTGLLDTTFPYGLSYDSPAQPFDADALQVTVSDTFTIYLFFKPSLANSIWVPLRKISWSWSGDASVSGTLNSSSHSSSQTGIDATLHPQWSANVRSLRFH